MKYLSFHLKDHVRENIECCFYEVIKFIEGAKKEGGRVYVHCVQGISRSTTMILCYMIFTQKITLDEGLKYIRERR
jgi:protein-tyrosine phosphatase